MGILSTFNDSVVLVNRTSRDLTVRYDGEDIIVKPGDNPGFPRIAVPYAKKQNPLMGSQHPYNPMQYISLLGVKGTDDTSPITDEVLHAGDAKLERMDRSGEFHGEPMAKVKLLKKSGYTPYEARASVGFDANSNIE